MVTLLREMGPVLIAVIVIGRSGSAVAAELGTMKVSEEIEALEVMAINPIRYLIVPRFLAMLVMLPALTILGNSSRNDAGSSRRNLQSRRQGERFPGAANVPHDWRRSSADLCGTGGASRNNRVHAAQPRRAVALAFTAKCCGRKCGGP